jgi:hypothetical protein
LVDLFVRPADAGLSGCWQRQKGRTSNNGYGECSHDVAPITVCTADAAFASRDANLQVSRATAATMRLDPQGDYFGSTCSLGSDGITWAPAAAAVVPVVTPLSAGALSDCFPSTRKKPIAQTSAIAIAIDKDLEALIAKPPSSQSPSSNFGSTGTWVAMG